jgi:hypothetical protein
MSLICPRTHSAYHFRVQMLLFALDPAITFKFPRKPRRPTNLGETNDVELGSVPTASSASFGLLAGTMAEGSCRCAPSAGSACFGRS